MGLPGSSRLQTAASREFPMDATPRPTAQIRRVPSQSSGRSSARRDFRPTNAMPITNHFSLLIASASYLREHPRRRVPANEESVHKAGFENSWSGPEFAPSAAKQDGLMFSQGYQVD